MDNKKTTADDMETLSPEEIKAIGEIEIGPSKQDQFLNKHYKKLIVGGIVLLVAISAGICIATFREQHKEAAAAALTDAAFNPTTENIAKVKQEYSGTVSAETAGLLEGCTLLQSDATAEQGVAALQTFASNTKNDLLRARALSAIALHYMGCISDADRAATTQKAIDAWKKVVELPVNPYTASAYVALGDMAKSLGDTAAARTYYSALLADDLHVSAASKQQASLRLAYLETDDPVLVEPAPQPAESPAGQDVPGLLPDSSSVFGQFSTPAQDAPATQEGVIPAVPAVTDPAPAETPAETDMPVAPEVPAETDMPVAPEVPAEAPAEAPAETPAEAPAEAPAETPAEAQA